MMNDIDILEIHKCVNIGLCLGHIMENLKETHMELLKYISYIYEHINDPLRREFLCERMSDILYLGLDYLYKIFRSKRLLIITSTNHMTMRNYLRDLLRDINLYKEARYNFLYETINRVCSTD